MLREIESCCSPLAVKPSRYPRFEMTRKLFASLSMSNEVKSHTTFRKLCVLQPVDGQHRAQTSLYGACGMCVRRFG